jgi:hypothetical protein
MEGRTEGFLPHRANILGMYKCIFDPNEDVSINCDQIIGSHNYT